MAEVIEKTKIKIVKMSSAQRSCLRKFGERVENLGMRMAAFNVDGSSLMQYPKQDQPASSLYEQYAIIDDQIFTGRVEQITQNVFCQSLNSQDQHVVTVVIETATAHLTDDLNIQQFCDQNGIAPDTLDDIFNNSTHNKRYIEDILVSFAKEFKNVEKVGQQLDMVSSELARTYEELVLMYNMSTNMKVTQSNATYLQMACDQVTQRVPVEGIAIYLEKKSALGTKLVLTAGSGVVSIDPNRADILQMHLAEDLKSGKDALLDSNVDSPFLYSWPDTIKNVIAVPMMGGEKMIGLMVATNIQNKPDFDSNEVKLFSSVANQCAVFVDNGTLFTDLKELFVGSLKALTSSIDAKDQYTRGHSERVAFISRWIAERYAERHGLEEEYIHKVYLAGLLHDIGKIGISETVLCKNGKLNEDERNQIKSHPRIGATILSEIKQMSEVLQGALCHHERADGKGYPEGLSGNQIPLLGKIISLADAFDAMTSRRVYRDAMDIDVAIEQIRQGTGTQFDEDVAKVFLDSDIKKLWMIIQDGFIESWDYSNFAEYGAAAVGTLLR